MQIPRSSVRAGVALLVLASLLLIPRVSAFQGVGVHYSPRLGIEYELVTYGGAYGARLTSSPSPGSPLLQEQAQLKKGDMITNLDQSPITAMAELERHTGQTSVQFLNAKTKAVEVRWVYLPGLNAPAVPRRSSGVVETSVTSGYSPRFGIFYQLVTYGGAYGARLKAAPVAGSPLLQEQSQLETGDLITHIDGTPLAGASALENHHGQTSIQVVNIRTGVPEVRWVYLPMMTDPGVPPRYTGRMLPPISKVPPGIPRLVPPRGV